MNTEPTAPLSTSPDNAEGVSLHVAPEQARMRLDKALAMLAGEISRARLQQVIREGGVSLNRSEERRVGKEC